jgi:hypothetical protein
VTWLVRGDVEGFYDLEAGYSATLEPIGEPVYLVARTQQPLHVWGASALRTRILVDRNVTRWGPYHVDIEVENVSDVPVYNFQVEMLDRAADAPEEEAQFFYAPFPPQVQGTAAIEPQTKFTARYTLFAGLGNDEVTKLHVVLERSFVERTGGDVDLAPTIELRTESNPVAAGGPVTVDVQHDGPDPAPDEAELSWARPEVLDGAFIAGYQVYTRQQLDGGKWEPYRSLDDDGSARPRLTIPAKDRAQGRYYAVGTQLLDGRLEFVHDIGVGPSRYVSLGDSFSAGEGVPAFEPGTAHDVEPVDGVDNKCHRSARGSYGRLLVRDPEVRANLLPATFRACSGAVTSDLSGANPDNDGEPAQIDRLSEFSNVVSLSMGGNDIGFGDIAALCAAIDCTVALEAYGAIGSRGWTDGIATMWDDVSFLTARIKTIAAAGESCGNLVDLPSKVMCAYRARKAMRALSEIVDRDENRVATPRNLFNGALRNRLETGYAMIAARAPNARVYVQLYPQIVDGSNSSDACHLLGSAFPLVSLSRNEREAVRSVVERLNAEIKAAVAHENDVLAALGRPRQFTAVDPGAYFAGNELCRNGQINAGAHFNTIVNPFLDVGAGIGPVTYSFHPNALGQEDYEQALAAALGNDLNAAVAVPVREDVEAGSVFVPFGARVLHADSAWRGSTVSMSLVAPDGTVLRAGDPGVRSGGTATTQSLEIDDPQPGTWRVRLFGDDVDPAGEPTAVRAFADVPLPPAPAVELASDPEGGDVVQLTADGPVDATYSWLFSDGETADGPSVTHTFANDGVRWATVRVRTPAGGETVDSIDLAPGPDSEPPAIETVPDVTAEASDPRGAQADYRVPVAFDGVDGAVAVACDPDRGDWVPLGVTTVHCSALDAAGNEAQTSFTVEVVDTTAPRFDAAADVTAEATGRAGAAVTYGPPHARDLIDGDVAPICAPASGAVFPIGDTRVDCEATDAAGNTAGAGFTVTVRDTSAPAITVPGVRTVEATSAAGATVRYDASAADVASDIASFACTPASGATLPIGTTTVTCSAEDSRGNRGSASFDVVVRDTTGPVIEVPAPVTVRATSPAGAVVSYALPTAADAVDGAAEVTCAPPSGSTFALGAHTVTCSASDSAHNTSTAGFTVTVVDGRAPVIHTPGDLAVEATSAAGATVSFQVTADDPGGSVASLACSPGSASTFALGTTTVRCVARDDDGNEAVASFEVTVRDTTAPLITGVPAAITLPASSTSGAVVRYTAPHGRDAVSGTVPVTCAPTSGATFAIGTTTVRCRASDAARNVRTAAFTVTVTPTGSVNEGHDAAAPVIAKRVKRSRIAVECPGAGPDCAVTIVIKAGKKRIGRAKAALHADKTRKVKLQLSRKGKRLLQRRHRVIATIVVTVRRADLVSRRTLHTKLKSRGRS